MDGLIIPPYTIHESPLHVQGLVLLKFTAFFILLASFLVSGPSSSSVALAEENPAVLSGAMLRSYAKALDETADIEARLAAIVEAIDKAETLIADHAGTLQGIQLATQGKFGVFDLKSAKELKAALERGEKSVAEESQVTHEPPEPATKETTGNKSADQPPDDEATTLAKKVAEQLRANGFQPQPSKTKIEATETQVTASDQPIAKPIVPEPETKLPTPAPREELAVNVPRPEPQPEDITNQDPDSATNSMAVVLVAREGPVRDGRVYKIAKSTEVLFGVFVSPDVVLVRASGVSNAKSISVARKETGVTNATLQQASKRYRLADQDLALLKLEQAIGDTTVMIAPQDDGLLANGYLVAVPEGPSPQTEAELKQAANLPKPSIVETTNESSEPIAALDKCLRLVGFFTGRERSPTDPSFTTSVEVADFLRQAGIDISADETPCPR